VLLCSLTLLCKVRKYPIYCQIFGNIRIPGSRLIAAPVPCLRHLCGFGPYGVQHHVPTQLQQITLLLYNDGFISPLEDVSRLAVPSIESLGVNSIEVPHPPAEIALRGFDNQMIVIIHQAIGVAEPVEPGHDGCQNAKKK